MNFQNMPFIFIVIMWFYLILLIFLSNLIQTLKETATIAIVSENLSWTVYASFFHIYVH